MEESIYHELFDYMHNEHDVILLESDIQEIIHIVNRINATGSDIE